MVASRASPKNNNRNRNNKKGKKNAAASQMTLLKKLLQNDMHREKMLTLQLLKYIADCNYLQPQRKEKLSAGTLE